MDIQKGFPLFFFPYFACSLRYTLFSEVRPKSTNHHSHNCNYCINTKQHTGDAQNVYDLNETRKRLQYAMARKNKMQTFTAKKERQLVFFLFLFSCQLWFYMLQSLTTTLIKKMRSHNDNKQALQRRWTDVYHEGDLDNKCYKEQRDKQEVGDGD